jgi:hypothetical protein
VPFQADSLAFLNIPKDGTDNYPSLRAGMRGGYPVVGYAGYIHLFGKLFSFRTAGAKKTWLSLLHAKIASGG